MSDLTYPVRSIGTTFRVIEALDELGEAGITEIAATADASNSTTHKHLNTLRQLGYVRKEGTTYALSLRFLGLGTRARSRYDIVRVAKPFIDDLSVTAGEMANLVVLEGSYGLYAYRSPDAIETADTLPAVGEPVYLHTTAAGKAILAALEWETIREIIDDVGFPEGTEQGIGSRRRGEQEFDSIRNSLEDRRGRLIFQLRRELRSIRDRGFAVDRSEEGSSLRCIAAPIATDTGPVAAVSVSTDGERPDEAELEEELTELVVETADVIEAELER